MKQRAYVAPCVQALNLPVQQNQRSCDMFLGVPFNREQERQAGDVGPARWKVLLALPFVGLFLWWVATFILSGGDYSWLYTFLFR